MGSQRRDKVFFYFFQKSLNAPWRPMSSESLFSSFRAFLGSRRPMAVFPIFPGRSAGLKWTPSQADAIEGSRVAAILWDAV